jgi:DNA-binding MarR family transcriptional regulator
MRHSKQGEAFTELVLEVFRFNGELLAVGNRLAQPLGLTSARWQVLGAIEGEALSVAQIARKMGLARQSVQRLSDLLRAEGSVAYSDNPTHRRAQLVSLTPSGRRALERLNTFQVMWANEVTKQTSAKDLVAAVRLLRELRDRL